MISLWKIYWIEKIKKLLILSSLMIQNIS